MTHYDSNFKTLFKLDCFLTFLECYFCKGEINKAKRQRFMKIKQNINPLYFPTDRHNNRTHNIRTTIFSFNFLLFIENILINVGPI